MGPPGEDATVEVRPPAAAGVAEECPAPARAAAGEPAGRGVVLLVEDEELVRTLASRLLARDGYEVLEAADGTAALALAAAHGGDLDLLLCDVVMPGMGGLELAERLAAVRPGLPVLFMSGYNDPAVAGFASGGVEAALMPKPFTPAIFSERVAAAIAAAPPRG